MVRIFLFIALVFNVFAASSMDVFFDWRDAPPSLIGLADPFGFECASQEPDIIITENTVEQGFIEIAQEFLRKADYEKFCQHLIALIQWVDETESEDLRYITTHNLLEQIFEVDIKFNELLAKYLSRNVIDFTPLKLRGIFRFYGIFLDRDLASASDSFSTLSPDSDRSLSPNSFAAEMLKKIEAEK
jgi:hypothetical protein